MFEIKMGDNLFCDYSIDVHIHNFIFIRRGSHVLSASAEHRCQPISNRVDRQPMGSVESSRWSNSCSKKRKMGAAASGKSHLNEEVCVEERLFVH
jgi:hypothetical protein